MNRANIVNPKFVELHKSRGMETYEHKLFMRSTGIKKFSTGNF